MSPRKSKAFLKRSAAAKRGAVTRQRNKQKAIREQNSRNKKRREKARDKREIAAEKHKIYRVTVLLPYSIRPKRSRSKKKKGKSPQPSSLRVTAFYKTKKEALTKKASLMVQAEKRLHDLMEKDARIFRRILKADTEIESLSTSDKIATRLLRQDTEIVDEMDMEEIDEPENEDQDDREREDDEDE